jgi:hypothetical protein
MSSTNLSGEFEFVVKVIHEMSAIHVQRVRKLQSGHGRMEWYPAVFVHELERRISVNPIGGFNPQGACDYHTNLGHW